MRTPVADRMVIAAFAGLAASLPASGQEAPIALSSPSVFIGSEANGGVSFSRITEVAPLPDGRIAVGDDGARQVLILDPANGRTEVWGREGQGPGEFESVRGMWVDGSSLHVFDSRAGRLTSFTPEGGVGETISLDQAPGSFGVPGMATSGAVGGKLFFGGLTVGAVEGTIGEDVLTLMRYSNDGRYEATLGSAVNMLREFAPGGSGPHLLSPRAWIAGYGSVVYMGNGIEPVVHRFSASGAEREPMILSGLPRPLGQREAWDKVDSLIAEGELPASVTARLAAQSRGVGQVPFYSGLLLDRVDGSIWVKEFDANGDYLPLPFGRSKPGGVWHQVAASGETVARYEMPERFVLLRVHDGRFLGYTVGAFDEHIVTVFERP